MNVARSSTLFISAAWLDTAPQQRPANILDFNLALGSPLQCWTPRCTATYRQALEEATALSRNGAHVLLAVPYEAAPCFDKSLIVQDAALSSLENASAGLLLAYLPEQVFKAVDLLNSDGELRKGCAAADMHWVSPWQDMTTADEFLSRFKQIQDWIAQGEFYQLNWTTRLQATLALDAAENEPPNPSSLQLNHTLWRLFVQLFNAQPAALSCFVHHDTRALLSFTPELFFKWDPRTRRLETRPMKGTRKPQVGARTRLSDSEKDRAENVMIVDLLRNDLAKVCEPRTVRVDSLFDVMVLPSVEQMTSTISGITRPEIEPWHLMQALFPCGSVTGAPKGQSMKRIAQLEPQARGLYCGALGWMKPGGEMQLAVPIRTVEGHISPMLNQVAMTYGVGSGITWYSRLQDERLEWWQKSVFLRQASSAFHVLETVRLHNGAWRNFEWHVARMRRTARELGMVWTDAQVQQLEAFAERQNSDYPQRGRWLLDETGQLAIEVFPLEPNPPHISLVLADRPMRAGGMALRHKTTFRPHYEAFQSWAQRQTVQADDVLLWNEAGLLTETCRFNVVLKIQNAWYTPAFDHSDGGNLLPGILRERLLMDNTLMERPLSVQDLQAASEVWVINSLRGCIPVAKVLSAAGDTLHAQHLWGVAPHPQ